MRVSYIGIAALAIAVAGNAARTSAEELPRIPPINRVLPPPGIEIPEEQRAKLRAAIDDLETRIRQVRKDARDPERMFWMYWEFLPDVEVYLNAVKYALENGEFYDAKDVQRAHDLLKTGHDRLANLLRGDRPWRTQTGSVVRGYRSQIDGSAQPYGVVVPETKPQARQWPVYVWLHGRGDKNTELKFLLERQSKPGKFVPDDALVVHPFGRHCNAFKFAGEVDVLEAVAAAKIEYQQQTRQLGSVLCGFSMGGAGAWHLGAHMPDLWIAVSPGAGFAETKRYQNITPDKYPAWYEQVLWGWYDAPHYVRNLFNLPVVAYSGELDKQIQAARVMEEAFVKEGRTLPHLIGPGMGHDYHPDTLKELRTRLKEMVAKSDEERFPTDLHLQTRTLQYGACHWVRLLGLQRHWQEARVDAKLNESTQSAQLTTTNVTALEIFPVFAHKIDIDSQSLTVPSASSAATLERQNGQWRLVDRLSTADRLTKRLGLHGPIDHAFMSKFLVVTPSGRSTSPLVQRWVEFELAHFKDRWRRIFRGDVREKKDTDVSEDDFQQYHVIAWGDPASNKLLAQVAGELPFAWDEKALKVGDSTYPAAGHVPVMIYPNPFSPSKYLVINSGPTFREGHDSSNSLQTPKLPDWAVIDLSQLPDARAPGRVADAGFFDEQWRFTTERPTIAP